MFRTARVLDVFDVAVVGGGLAGIATALRLQAAGLATIVFEAHGHAGGCAGYYRKRGFSFDVGATTLVDFETGGLGARFLEDVGAPPMKGEALAGYTAWMPDRVVHLYRDPARWHAERLDTLGRTPAHLAFWSLMDGLSAAFWQASRAGVRLPMRRPADAWHNLRAVKPRHLPLARFAYSTMGQALRRFGLRDDKPLAGLMAMLVEDTVHAALDEAPLINSALGATIRGAGLSRHEGGMHGFWRSLVAHYRALGGTLRAGCDVRGVTGLPGHLTIQTRLGSYRARQVVCAVPAETAARICRTLPVAHRLQRYLGRDDSRRGGAVVAFLGVPENEITDRKFTHHQLLQDYDRPLGNGNNMFVSVSAPGDEHSAPAGHRAVMISTHTTLEEWRGEDYEQHKKEIGERLVGLARRVYPRLGERACFFEVGTPRSYERFAFRPGGAVGGPRQSLDNTNQHAIPHDLGGPGLWLVGDSTWPGLGTVACVLGSRIVAEGALRWSSRLR
jgi:C-3',4' desaturase CrtD